MNQSVLYIATGSNMGDRDNSLKSAIEQIGLSIGTVTNESPVYETEAWGYDGSPYLNQVIEVKTDYEPHEVLELILEIEDKLGRDSRNGKYEDRIIDIDLLFYDLIKLVARDLVIPHPHLHERKFVLQPLADIAPTLVHPIIGLTVNQLLSECTDNGQITPISCATNTLR